MRMLAKILNIGSMLRYFIEEKNMKYILFILCIALFACDGSFAWWDNCSCEKNREFIRVYAHADVDTIISSEYFEYSLKYAMFKTEYKDFGSDTISASIIGMGDTLNYSLEIKNEASINIIVDTSNTPCATDSILTKQGWNLYRVDGENIHSCVFYLDIICD